MSINKIMDLVEEFGELKWELHKVAFNGSEREKQIREDIEMIYNLIQKSLDNLAGGKSIC